jgi:hypothetical protein
VNDAFIGSIRKPQRLVNPVARHLRVGVFRREFSGSRRRSRSRISGAYAKEHSDFANHPELGFDAP